MVLVSVRASLGGGFRPSRQGASRNRCFCFVYASPITEHRGLSLLVGAAWLRHRAQACTNDRRILHAPCQQATGCRTARLPLRLLPLEVLKVPRNHDQYRIKPKCKICLIYAVAQLAYHASSQCLFFDGMNHDEPATVGAKARPIC